MPNFNTSLVNIPQLQTVNPLQTGEQYGRAVGNAVGAVGNVVGNMDVSDLIADYNDPNSTTFAGLQGSRRSEALAAKLQEYDPALAYKFMQQAKEERAHDYGITITGSANRLQLIQSLMKSISAELSRRMGGAGAASPTGEPSPSSTSIDDFMSADNSQAPQPSVPSIPTPLNPSFSPPDIYSAPKMTPSPLLNGFPAGEGNGSSDMASVQPNFQNDLQARVSKVLNSGNQLLGSLYGA